MKKFLLVVLAVSWLPATAPAQTRKKIVITNRGPAYSQIGPAELAMFKTAAPTIDIVIPEGADRVMSELANADGIIGNITPAMIKAAPKLRWVQAHSAGVENILFPELRNSNIALTNCKIVQSPEIADHAFAMLLALTRELHRIVPRRTREEWPRSEYKPIELLGRTALVIGVGGIGSQIAIRAHAFGMRVIGIDPKDLPYAPYLQRSAPPDRLNELLPEADVVFVAAPSTAQTERMMGAKQFSLMKKGSYFIAVSRGKLYDQKSLVDAIETKHLAGAGLDVTDPEPLPKGNPLWKYENVVITPHIAGRSDGEHARYMALFRDNLRRFANDEPLLNVVDKAKGY
jgi:phosphoglycerate dehydrogenase-like enzyme